MDFSDQVGTYQSQYNELKNEFYTKRDDAVAEAAGEERKGEDEEAIGIPVAGIGWVE